MKIISLHSEKVFTNINITVILIIMLKYKLKWNVDKTNILTQFKLCIYRNLWNCIFKLKVILECSTITFNEIITKLDSNV